MKTSQNNTFYLLACLLCAFSLFSAQAFGTDWQSMQSGVSVPLRGIWGSSATDVYAVGDSGTVLHYNGTDWSETNASAGITEDLRDVWGAASDDIYAIGFSGVVLHYDGSTWKHLSSSVNNDLYGIWGNSSSSIYISGSNGLILFYNGSQFEIMRTPSSADLTGIWGSSADNVFAVGENGTIFQYDGSTWSEFENTDTTEDLKAVWGTSETDVFAAGLSGTILHYGGNSWSKMGVINTDYWGIGGTISPNIYAVAKNGQIYSYSNGRWTKSSETNTDYILTDIWVSPEDDSFIVGYKGTILLASENRPAENTEPTASFSIDPESGTTDTIFKVDASTSTDTHNSIEDLQIRWDWDSDGTWDTGYATDKIAYHQYEAKGTYTITLEVKDSSDQTGQTNHDVIVSATTNKIGCPAEKILGKNDPCLQTIRQFRDQILSHSPLGTACISMYYSHNELLNDFIASNPLLEQRLKKLLVNATPLLQTAIDRNQ